MLHTHSAVVKPSERATHVASSGSGARLAMTMTMTELIKAAAFEMAERNRKTTGQRQSRR